jgi:hypothetical protein
LRLPLRRHRRLVDRHATNVRLLAATDESIIVAGSATACDRTHNELLSGT